HYGPALTLRQHGEKLALNLWSSTVQLFDPNSQPWWCREPVAAVGRTLAGTLPVRDPYAFEDLDRRATMLVQLQKPWPDADFTTPGILLALLFLAGAGLAAGRRRQAPAAMVVVWVLGVGLYAVTQHALIQWHPWGFRYAVLVAPWLGITAAWALEQMPRPAGLVLWVVALVSAAMVLADTTWYCPQSGRQALPGMAPRGRMMNGWRDWAQALAQDTAGLQVALSGNQPLANFYRLGAPCPVHLLRLSGLKQATAAAVVADAGPGWLVVPLGKFSGREGRVMARTWLYGGDRFSSFSLAAYRTLRPGENPTPVLYRHRAIRDATGVRHELLVRSWQPGVRLELGNPTAAEWTFTIIAPAGETRGLLPAGTGKMVAVPVSADGLTVLTVNFIPPAGSAPVSRAPAVVTVRGMADGPEPAAAR
ncbi:MAG: hypothetical protein ACHQ5A_07810, partial [Opitutales bacterium]